MPQELLSLNKLLTQDNAVFSVGLEMAIVWRNKHNLRTLTNMHNPPAQIELL